MLCKLGKLFIDKAKMVVWNVMLFIFILFQNCLGIENPSPALDSSLLRIKIPFPYDVLHFLYSIFCKIGLLLK